jgi:hypothetical protein
MVQVVRKDFGWYRVVCKFGTSSDPDTIERLWIQANPKELRFRVLHMRSQDNKKALVLQPIGCRTSA